MIAIQRTLIAILGLALLMIVHECGHFFVARAFGMRVIKFSIGFGPTFFKVLPQDGYFWFTTAAGRVRLRLWKHDPERHGPTVYQLAMIPFLAYVQIAGMNPLEEIDENDKGSYANASLIGRILTIFGGPAANYLFASVLIFIAYLAGGQMVPKGDEPGSTEVTVIAGLPAEAAGLKTGDRVVEVALRPVDTWEEMAGVISKHPGEAIPIVVERAGQRVTISVTPRRAEPPPGKKGVGKGKIGVQQVVHHESLTAQKAAILALREPPRVVKRVVVSLGQWASGEVEGELSGPIGMVRAVASVALSPVELLYFLGEISAYLGAFNLIPFPALDGGRLMFLGYEATTRRRPNAKIETQIHLVGLLMMLGLMCYVTFFNDLRRSDAVDGSAGALPPAASATSGPPAGAESPGAAPAVPPAPPAPAAAPAAPGGK